MPHFLVWLLVLELAAVPLLIRMLFQRRYARHQHWTVTFRGVRAAFCDDKQTLQFVRGSDALTLSLVELGHVVAAVRREVEARERWWRPAKQEHLVVGLVQVYLRDDAYEPGRLIVALRRPADTPRCGFFKITSESRSLALTYATLGQLFETIAAVRLLDEVGASD